MDGFGNVCQYQVIKALYIRLLALLGANAMWQPCNILRPQAFALEQGPHTLDYWVVLHKLG